MRSKGHSLFFWWSLCGLSLLALSCFSSQRNNTIPSSSQSSSSTDSTTSGTSATLPDKYAVVKKDKWTVIHYGSAPHGSSDHTESVKGAAPLKYRSKVKAADVAAIEGAVAKAIPRRALIRKVSSRRVREPGRGLASPPTLSPQPVVQQSPLKAGEKDDNRDFDEYLSYYRKNHTLLPPQYRLDVTERYVIEVEGADGKKVPNVQITITSPQDKILWKGRTDSHGRLCFFPRTVPEAEGVREFLLSYSYRGKGGVHTFQRSRHGSDTPWKVKLENTKSFQEVQLDLLFLLDATGSMSDEIARIQATLQMIVSKIRSLQTGKSLKIRYGMVLYRDRGDTYVVKQYPFTSSLEEFHQALRKVRAGGGGDTPEAMNTGLFVAVENMDWDLSDSTLRLVFLVADAPPHLDYQDDVPYPLTLKKALAKGIKIYPIAASGLDSQGTFVMRQIALFTQAKFLYIDYGRGTAASHGIRRAGPSNNLDDLVVRIVQSELKAFTE